MKTTNHMHQRMSQRGVSRNMIDLALMYGRTDQDKHVLGRREAINVLETLSNEVRMLKKIVDKGGIVVVADGDALVTTYNCDQHFRVESGTL